MSCLPQSKVLVHQVVGTSWNENHGVNLGGLRSSFLIAASLPVELTLPVETKVLIAGMALVR